LRRVRPKLSAHNRFRWTVPKCVSLPHQPDMAIARFPSKRKRPLCPGRAFHGISTANFLRFSVPCSLFRPASRPLQHCCLSLSRNLRIQSPIRRSGLVQTLLSGMLGRSTFTQALVFFRPSTPDRNLWFPRRNPLPFRAGRSRPAASLLRVAPNSSGGSKYWSRDRYRLSIVRRALVHPGPGWGLLPGFLLKLP
jgi:hypothetical protein